MTFLSAGGFILASMATVFVACTYGLIEGKTWGWALVSWGAPLANLGYTIFYHHFDYGTDPNAMIGWENATKTPFFAQIMFYGWVSSMFLCEEGI